MLALEFIEQADKVPSTRLTSYLNLSFLIYKMGLHEIILRFLPGLTLFLKSFSALNSCVLILSSK